MLMTSLCGCIKMQDIPALHRKFRNKTREHYYLHPDCRAKAVTIINQLKGDNPWKTTERK